MQCTQIHYPNMHLKYFQTHSNTISLKYKPNGPLHYWHIEKERNEQKLGKNSIFFFILGYFCPTRK